MNKIKYTKTENLKKERANNGYTYENMAKMMGYKSNSTYMYIENGQTVPTLPVMLQISKIFNKPINCFFVTDYQAAQIFKNENLIPTGTDG